MYLLLASLVHCNSNSLGLNKYCCCFAHSMLHNLYKCGHTIIINNYWMRLSKISWFVSGEQIIMCWSRRLRQIIDVRDTGKWRYFAITEFNNCFIIRSPSLFFNDHLREVKWSAFFMQECLQEGEKCGFVYASAEYYLQPNTVGRHCALRMSRPLFVVSYLQVTWWAFGQWKERKICIEWQLILLSMILWKKKILVKNTCGCLLN